jgi:hypothetical protein
MYVTAEGHGLNIFYTELQLSLRNEQFFKLLQAHQQRRSVPWKTAHFYWPSLVGVVSRGLRRYGLRVPKARV